MGGEREAGLIRKVQELGCLHSFAQLVKGLRLYRYVYQLLGRYTRCDDERMQMTQEVMYIAFERLQEQRDAKESLQSLFYYVALQEAHKHLKRKIKYRTIPIKLDQAMSPGPLFGASHPSMPITDALASNDLHAASPLH